MVTQGTTIVLKYLYRFTIVTHRQLFALCWCFFLSCIIHFNYCLLGLNESVHHHMSQFWNCWRRHIYQRTMSKWYLCFHHCLPTHLVSSSSSSVGFSVFCPDISSAAFGSSVFFLRLWKVFKFLIKHEVKAFYEYYFGVLLCPMQYYHVKIIMCTLN